MSVRTSIARTCVLAVVISGVVGVVGSASAAVVQTPSSNLASGDFDDLPTEATCTVTQAGSTDSSDTGTLTLTQEQGTSPILGLPVLKVTARVNISVAKHKDIAVVLKNSSKAITLSSSGFLGLGGGDPNFTNTVFDDAAATSIDNAASPRTGTYRPSVPLSGFNNSETNGTWTLTSKKDSLAGTAGTISSWSLTITYDCDFDDDTRANEDDNCPEVDNYDQRNTDGDKLGDVCDPDMDGDGVANGDDNCPSNANATQRDMNHNGMGDPCDPDADSDGYEKGDACPLAAAYNDTGCPPLARTGTIAYGVRVKQFKGVLRSPVNACVSRKVVELRRVMGPGRSARVGLARTSTRGVWTLPRARRKPGKFYALIKPTFLTQGLCRQAQSKVIRVR
ncbi:thrombospondin type 3 repeat-containing protein [Nocardioides sp. Root151]|uniref:thrombospondin type 3 repeat-containing protein n=1 Tax=Nocardioides sp. Root151 TaxID=1736475 RepID=UPI00070286CF|nr:thrombospondin type 3 repeat-containing protein [Nocardioides sp. Root151]KQZ67081.1 hypothetical protein ASD66_19000 [Nocardioides sp. Root151]